MNSVTGAGDDRGDGSDGSAFFRRIVAEGGDDAAAAGWAEGARPAAEGSQGGLEGGRPTAAPSPSPSYSDTGSVGSLDRYMEESFQREGERDLAAADPPPPAADPAATTAATAHAVTTTATSATSSGAGTVHPAVPPPAAEMADARGENEITRTFLPPPMRPQQPREEVAAGLRPSSSSSESDEVELIEPPLGHGHRSAPPPWTAAGGHGGGAYAAHAAGRYGPPQNPFYGAAVAPPVPPPAAAAVPLPAGHVPTWRELLPRDYFRREAARGAHPGPVVRHPPPAAAVARRTKLSLSLINMWEFTITVEVLECGYGGGGGVNGFGGIGTGYRDGTAGYGNVHSGYYGGGSHPAEPCEPVAGLRAQIKKISREHPGKDGRMGAIFEREGIAVAEPLLKAPAEKNGGNAFGSAGQGRWRIPLGAYQSLMTLLSSDRKNWVEGIPVEQLRAATLGRERTEKKFPTVRMLIRREVSPVVASALAPYQRGGVDFILDKEGRVLLADEMGLGKTVQAIAAMSAYRKKDWPLLVLCPSSARYHWEAEFRQWLGSEAKMRLENEARKKNASDISFPDNRHSNRDNIESAYLKNNQINVLTSGKSQILNSKTGTAVVICSFGLITNLATSKRIFPGMFSAVIVDESHALKSKSTKRTKAVLPILKAAERCLLLSGTPALARPSELWPQLSCLGRRRGRYDGRGNGDGIETEAKAEGIWCDEKEFTDKYVRPKGEENNKTKLAELHTLLTSTVMIRRMKADILKNLPSKIREKAMINITDIKLQSEFRTYMMMLRQGKGVMGKLARAYHAADKKESDIHADASVATSHEAEETKSTLHYLYSLTGQSKIARVTKNLVAWLADPSKGKICIFAHHLGVLDAISAGANLSNDKASINPFIRIDGSTSPKDRQERILRFQTDPKVRVAMLGITAAGVAVTLTASSTVWFAELFWTPAIMIQAEDRCHRIGQQARVRCLYFIARGTLDDVLWKLIEKKFRDLGAFVEGKENMDIALERELEDGEDDEIIKTEENQDKVGDGSGKKRKAQDTQDGFNEILEEPDLKKEIDQLCHEEEDMLNVKNKEDEDELNEPELIIKEGAGTGSNVTVGDASATRNKAKQVIELLDDEDENDEDENKPLTIAYLRKLYRSTGIFNSLRMDPCMQLKNMCLYTVQYQGPSYGLIMVSCNARVVVKAQSLEGQAGPSRNLKSDNPRIGSIIVAINEHVVPYNAQFVKVLQLMKVMMRTPPVTIMFGFDDEFASMFAEDFIPNIPVHRTSTTMVASASSLPASAAMATSASNSSYRHTLPSRQQHNSEVIDLLDDD